MQPNVKYNRSFFMVKKGLQEVLGCLFFYCHVGVAVIMYFDV